MYCVLIVVFCFLCSCSLTLVVCDCAGCVLSSVATDWYLRFILFAFVFGDLWVCVVGFRICEVLVAYMFLFCGCLAWWFGALIL